MNAHGILQTIVVIAAIVVAVILLIKYGFISWEFWLGSPGVALVAWFLLWVINFAMPHLNNQADQVVDQMQVLGNQSAPEFMQAPEGGAPVQQLFVDPNQGGSGGGDVIITAPTAPPTQVVHYAGEVVWVGNRYPNRNDNLIPFQLACYGNDQNTWLAMLNKGPAGVPYGATVTSSVIRGALWEGAEAWTFTIQFPSNQAKSIMMTDIDGTIGNGIQDNLGGDFVEGQGAWPLVQATYGDATNYTITMPVVCA